METIVDCYRDPDLEFLVQRIASLEGNVFKDSNKAKKILVDI